MDAMLTGAYLTEMGFKHHSVRNQTVAEQIGNGDCIVLCQFLNYGHVVAIKDDKVIDTWNSGSIKATRRVSPILTQRLLADEA